uniref:Uncharacterized protein n=1 Tax=Arundo donax TaxID=35708 RepID=A0A0A9EN66_ARUDO
MNSNLSSNAAIAASLT